MNLKNEMANLFELAVDVLILMILGGGSILLIFESLFSPSPELTSIGRLLFGVLGLLLFAIFILLLLAVLRKINQEKVYLDQKVVEAVEYQVVVKNIVYSGYIKTSLDDIDFLQGILLEWAQFPQNEVEALLSNLSDSDMLTDKYLRDSGFCTEDNSGSIDAVSVNLIKFGDGKWVVDDMSFEDLEEFAESVYGNLE